MQDPAFPLPGAYLQQAHPEDPNAVLDTVGLVVVHHISESNGRKVFQRILGHKHLKDLKDQHRFNFKQKPRCFMPRPSLTYETKLTAPLW